MFFFMIKLFSFFPGYKRYSAHFLYVFATYKTSIDFIFITSLGQIFTRRTGESHPGQFNRTPAQRTFSSFTICLISFFRVLPGQPFKAFAPAVCTRSPSWMPWWSKGCALGVLRKREFKAASVFLATSFYFHLRC